MNLTKLIAAVFLVSCASTQETAKTAIKAVESCEYLQEYAEKISDALNAKDYTLAMSIANVAYLKSLEEPQTPCLESANNIKNHVVDFVLESTEKQVETK